MTRLGTAGDRCSSIFEHLNAKAAILIGTFIHSINDSQSSRMITYKVRENIEEFVKYELPCCKPLSRASV